MAHKQYFKAIDPLKIIEPLIPTICPTSGYYDPSLPIPYIPLLEPPELSDDQIVLVCTTDWDSAIAFITVLSAGQAKYDVLSSTGALIFSQNVASGVEFFYAFNSVNGSAFQIKI
ncbi:MAG: hypothetical protein Q8J76_08305, partial [Desulfobulbaceae bacterium]|nr:hypothetical protein [Desulfobulbaceae bacterium]